MTDRRRGLPAALREREQDLEQACSDLIAYDGWRPLKTDPVSDRYRAKGFGELGMADRLYIRYEMEGPRLSDSIADRAWCQLMWIEWKRRGGKAKPHQIEWIAAERARGALVLLAGVDFPADFDGFLAWYRKSGLMRRPL